MSSFYVFSAGCIRRGLEIIHIQKYLLANGWTLTKRICEADLVVVATCGVVKLNEINSLKAISKAARERSPGADIIVTGCLPLINPDAINEIGDFVFIPSGQLDRFDNFTGAQIPIKDVEPPDSIADNMDIVNYLVARSFCRRSRVYKYLFYMFAMNRLFLAGSVAGNRLMGIFACRMAQVPRKKITPYYCIKIADGCASNCSFCATKMAIGGLKSKPLDAIVAEFRKGIDKGYNVFQLIAEDTGCYGLDIGINLGELLSAICRCEGEYQIIVIDCSPKWLIDRHDAIVTAMVAQQDKIKEVFSPVQSGSDKILRRMNREYKAGAVKRVFLELKERAPGIGLRTGLLVGFPGETDEDFEDTVQFISALDFAEVTVNRYEDRPGTKSAEMADKVSTEVIEQRAQILEKQFGCKILS